MRIIVIGLSGAGKSTLARALAEGTGTPHVELDALYWEPNWTPARPELFSARAEAATAGTAWVADGNYSAVRALVWGRATHLVWLDYERLPIMARVIRRSFLRAVTRKPLWNGNVELWHRWFSPDHPIRWAWSQWRRRRQSIEAELASGRWAHLAVMRLRHPDEAAPALHALLAEDRRQAPRAAP